MAAAIKYTKESEALLARDGDTLSANASWRPNATTTRVSKVEPVWNDTLLLLAMPDKATEAKSAPAPPAMTTLPRSRVSSATGSEKLSVSVAAPMSSAAPARRGGTRSGRKSSSSLASVFSSSTAKFGGSIISAMAVDVMGTRGLQAVGVHVGEVDVDADAVRGQRLRIWWT
eukprot:scaffold63_cov306-Pinguiococcus_pyrenoidosus.AAC.47